MTCVFLFKRKMNIFVLESSCAPKIFKAEKVEESVKSQEMLVLSLLFDQMYFKENLI